MKDISPVLTLLAFAAWLLTACSEFHSSSTENPPTIISGNMVITKIQRRYERSSDFRERLGKKIFDYEHAKPSFNPARLPPSGNPDPISGLPKNVLSPAELTRLNRAGITKYKIYWQDYWWGRSYWFYFYYRSGNSFGYDVYTDMKKNVTIYD